MSNIVAGEPNIMRPISKRQTLSLLVAIASSFGLASVALADSECGSESGGFFNSGGGTESGGFYGAGASTESGGYWGSRGQSESGGFWGSGGHTESGGVANSGGYTESGGFANSGGWSESGGFTPPAYYPRRSYVWRQPSGSTDNYRPDNHVPEAEVKNYSWKGNPPSPVPNADREQVANQPGIETPGTTTQPTVVTQEAAVQVEGQSAEDHTYSWGSSRPQTQQPAFTARMPVHVAPRQPNSTGPRPAISRNATQSRWLMRYAKTRPTSAG